MKITSLDMLKRCAYEQPFECRILLNHGLFSRKQVTYYPLLPKKKWEIYNHIDDTFDSFRSDKQFKKLYPLFFEAMDKGSLVFEELFHCIQFRINQVLFEIVNREPVIGDLCVEDGKWSELEKYDQGTFSIEQEGEVKYRIVSPVDDTQIAGHMTIYLGDFNSANRSLFDEYLNEYLIYHKLTKSDLVV